MKRAKSGRIGPLSLIVVLAFLGLLSIRLAIGAENDTQNKLDVSAASIPSEPPDASLISFGPLNGLGEAEVTGLPGAVLPDAHVLLVNLDTSHQAYTMTESDGSFQTKIFAPPGSNIMVKHGPDHTYRTPDFNLNPWQDIQNGAATVGRNLFPSTTIYRPHTHTGGADSSPFADVGSIGVNLDTNPTSIDAGWSMTGTLHPISDLHPGDRITAEIKIQIYSQAIESSTDVSTITLHMDDTVRWLMLYDGQGRPLEYNGFAGSSRLTPSGFPILDSRRPEALNPVEWQPIAWHYAGGNIIEGDVTLVLHIEESLPPGIYRPLMPFRISGVPAGGEWPAALLSIYAGLPSYNYGPDWAALPPVEVKSSVSDLADDPLDNQNLRLIWYLQMDRATLGTRGTGTVEDRDLYQPSSFVATQGSRYIIPPVEHVSGDTATYRLEPYLPMISYGRGTTPSPPLIPFKLPGGQLCVIINEPDGLQKDLGCEIFSQSISGDRTTALGDLPNYGTVEVSEYYGLSTNKEKFAVSFDKHGYHSIEMSGWIEDVWGNRYQGGGTFEVFVAQPIDIDPGLLPGSALALGDAINPAIQLNPRVPAYVNLVIRHYPESDPARIQKYVVEGWANRFGYFAPIDPPVKLNEPGEYRLDIFAEYINPENGESYAASLTWGGTVMTPPGQAQLVAHGLRGIDTVTEIPGSWYILDDLCNERENVLEDAQPHVPNPYLNGDIVWSRPDSDIADHGECVGDALYLVSSVQDSVGVIESKIQERFDSSLYEVMVPGTFDDRVIADELPLFSSTTTSLPVPMDPGNTEQIAYAYLSSQRPGVRVREVVAEDAHGSGYWRFDAAYDYQPGVGPQGDLPNDFKYQFVGAVYRDLENGVNEYLGQATGWVHLPYSDTVGSRVMPPFSGPGNGGWTTQGGPIMTLKGQDIHMFILPTGVRPGAILQIGDRFEFGGHLMPTLDSQVQVIVTSPSGTPYVVDGQANSVGYFYDPSDSFFVDEPGLWVVEVRVWHDGRIGSGEQVDCDPADPFDPASPCPSGDVLGSAGGFYPFYVVPHDSDRLTVTSPVPGRLTFGEEVTPIEISGPIPPGVTNASVDYTINMPGFILDEGQAQIDSGQFKILFDPKTLNKDFPNLDLHSRHGLVAGLADTFSIGLLLTGLEGEDVLYQATTITIQGDQVYIEDAIDVDPFQNHLYLPVLFKGD